MLARYLLIFLGLVCYKSNYYTSYVNVDIGIMDAAMGRDIFWDPLTAEDHFPTKLRESPFLELHVLPKP